MPTIWAAVTGFFFIIAILCSAALAGAHKAAATAKALRSEAAVSVVDVMGDLLLVRARLQAERGRAIPSPGSSLRCPARLQPAALGQAGQERPGRDVKPRYFKPQRPRRCAELPAHAARSARSAI